MQTLGTSFVSAVEAALCSRPNATPPTSTGDAAKGKETVERRVEEEDDSEVEEVDEGDLRPRKPTSTAREEHLLQLFGLRQQGVELLKEKGGFVQLETEGLGDCWLISLVAGCELEMSFVHHSW